MIFLFDLAPFFNGNELFSFLEKLCGFCDKARERMIGVLDKGGCNLLLDPLTDSGRGVFPIALLPLLVFSKG